MALEYHDRFGDEEPYNAGDCEPLDHPDFGTTAGLEKEAIVQPKNAELDHGDDDSEQDLGVIYSL